MNNETNNLNNPGNPSGMNFVQGGMPANNLPPQQPVNPMPAQPQVAPTPSVPPTAGPVPPIAPQPVNPEPIVQGPAAPMPSNFVAPNNPAPNATQPIGVPPIMKPVQNGVAPMPANPMAPPVMPQQPNMGMPQMNGQMAPNGMVPPMASNPNNVAPGDNQTGGKEPLPIVMIIITAVVVIGVIVFLILFLTGKISFSGKNKQGTGPEVIEQPGAEVVLADWMTYILDKNPTEIKLSRYVDSDNSKAATLTKEQLESLFAEMNGHDLVKYYSSSRAMSNDDLQISYNADGNAYIFTISGETITIGDDSNLKTLFDSIETAVEDDGETSTAGDEYSYIIKGFDTSTYDDYFTEISEENNG